MQLFTPIAGFFDAIQKDGRISITHIGVYAALVQFWQANGFATPMKAYAKEVMPLAKLSANTTYHKCIRDLHDFGYIFYEPSFKRNQPSKFSFKFLDQ